MCFLEVEDEYDDIATVFYMRSLIPLPLVWEIIKEYTTKMSVNTHVPETESEKSDLKTHLPETVGVDKGDGESSLSIDEVRSEGQLSAEEDRRILRKIDL